MNEEQKQQYLNKYKQEKQKGVKFWPDIIYKDLLFSFAIFILLVGLSLFLGVAAEPKVDPSDSSYVPRPEWYFMWLFEFLKYIPGAIEWVGAILIPTILVLALLLLPLYDRNPFRFWKKRIFAITMMTICVIGIVALTASAIITTPEQEEGVIITSISESITIGQDLYSLECVECHGADGEGGEIVGVEGLEGVVLKAINSTDEMYTRSDETLYNVIAYGQPDLGMPPLGSAFGGHLSPGEVESIVNFMRYTWDDRVELPEDAAKASAIPALEAGETPTWEKHIQLIFKRYCDSCHRPGKKNNNFTTLSYEEVLTTGDNTPVVVAGDPNSLMLRLLHREDIPDISGPMPPNKPLPDDFINMIELWVLAGMPETASDVTTAPEQPELAPTMEITATLEAGETPMVSSTPTLLPDTPEIPTATPEPPTPTSPPPTDEPSPTPTPTLEEPTPYP